MRYLAFKRRQVVRRRKVSRRGPPFTATDEPTGERQPYIAWHIDEIRRLDLVMDEWRQRVRDAEALFGTRWTLLSLRRVDNELFKELHDQIRLFDEEMLLGAPEQIEDRGRALCLGWFRACRVMEEDTWK
jgi:hypothetical protein